MTDLRTLMHDYVDRANTDADPITLDEIHHLATTLTLREEPVATPTRWYNHRRVPVAAVLTILALTLTALVALLVTRSDPDTIAEQPDATTTTTAAPAPEPEPDPAVRSLSLFPQGVEVTVHDAPADGSIVTMVDRAGTAEEWRQFLGIDPASVERVLVWRPGAQSALFVIEGDLDIAAVEGALAADPDWTGRTTTTERARVDVVVREVADDEPLIRTPLQAMRSHAIAIVDGAVVVGRDPQVLYDAIDRAEGADTLAASTGIASLLEIGEDLTSPDLHTRAPDAEGEAATDADEDEPSWYAADVVGVRSDNARQAVLAIRIAEGHDADGLAGAIDDGLFVESMQLPNPPAADVSAEGDVVTITATYGVAVRGSDLTALRESTFAVAEQGDDSNLWVPIIFVALLLGVATFAAYVDRRNGGRGRGPWRRHEPTGAEYAADLHIRQSGVDGFL